MSPKRKKDLGTRQDLEVKQVAFMLARGDQTDGVLRRWEKLVFDQQSLGGDKPIDVNALANAVIREAYLQNTEDLRFYAEKVKYYNERKKSIREYIQRLRDFMAQLKEQEQAAEANLDAIEDLSEQASIDLQEAMEKQSQFVQTISNIMKEMNDTAQNIIDNLK